MTSNTDLNVMNHSYR